MNDFTESADNHITPTSQLVPAILALADGQIFEGISVGANGDCIGELVFNTAMTGYQEMISDPSYSGQIMSGTC